MVDIQHYANRKRLQITEISFPVRKLGQGIELRGQNLHGKLINRPFCVYAVKYGSKSP